MLLGCAWSEANCHRRMQQQCTVNNFLCFFSGRRVSWYIKQGVEVDTYLNSGCSCFFHLYGGSVTVTMTHGVNCFLCTVESLYCRQARVILFYPWEAFFSDISNQMPPWGLLERHYFCVSHTCLSLVSFALSHVIQSFFGLFTATVYIHTCPP